MIEFSISINETEKCVFFCLSYFMVVNLELGNDYGGSQWVTALTVNG